MKNFSGSLWHRDSTLCFILINMSKVPHFQHKICCSFIFIWYLIHIVWISVSQPLTLSLPRRCSLTTQYANGWIMDDSHQMILAEQRVSVLPSQWILQKLWPAGNCGKKSETLMLPLYYLANINEHKTLVENMTKCKMQEYFWNNKAIIQ